MSRFCFFEQRGGFVGGWGTRGGKQWGKVYNVHQLEITLVFLA